MSHTQELSFTVRKENQELNVTISCSLPWWMVWKYSRQLGLTTSNFLSKFYPYAKKVFIAAFETLLKQHTVMFEATFGERFSLDITVYAHYSFLYALSAYTGIRKEPRARLSPDFNYIFFMYPIKWLLNYFAKGSNPEKIKESVAEVIMHELTHVFDTSLQKEMEARLRGKRGRSERIHDEGIAVFQTAVSFPSKHFTKHTRKKVLCLLHCASWEEFLEDAYAAGMYMFLVLFTVHIQQKYPLFASEMRKVVKGEKFEPEKVRLWLKSPEIQMETAGFINHWRDQSQRLLINEFVRALISLKIEPELLKAKKAKAA